MLTLFIVSNTNWFSKSLLNIMSLTFFFCCNNILTRYHCIVICLTGLLWHSNFFCILCINLLNLINTNSLLHLDCIGFNYPIVIYFISGIIIYISVCVFTLCISPWFHVTFSHKFRFVITFSSREFCFNLTPSSLFTVAIVMHPFLASFDIFSM